LAAVFDGREPDNPPSLGQVLDIMLRHAQKLADWMGEGPAMRAFRRHSSWYTKGFRGSARLRARLMTVGKLAELREAVEGLDRDERFPPNAMRVPRGKTAGTQSVALPDGYLGRLDDATPPVPEAEDAFSGG
jgi:hypothetical protein